MLGSNRFQQTMKNQNAHVFRQQRFEQFARRLLVYVIHLCGRELRCGGVEFPGIGWPQTHSGALRGLYRALFILQCHFLRLRHFCHPDLFYREDSFHHQALRNYRLEFVIYEIDRVNFVFGIPVDHALCKFGSQSIFDLSQHSNLFPDDGS